MELTRENYNETAKELLHFYRTALPAPCSEKCSRYAYSSRFYRGERGRSWKLEAGGRYFVTRNQSSVIAFKVPGKDLRLSDHSKPQRFPNL